MIIRAQRQVQVSFLRSHRSGPRPRLRRWVVRHRVLVVASCAGALAAGTHLVHAGASTTAGNPAVPSVLTSTTTVAFGPLPPSLTLHGAASWTSDLATLDTGIRASITADRQEGFRAGAVQQFADGPRLLRLVLRSYATAGGAEAAYWRQARFLSASLPDPSLRTTITRIAGTGGPSLRAIYASGSGARSYTVTTLLFRRGTLVGQIDAFPSGVSDGHPGADSRDELAIANGVVDGPTP